MKLLSLGSTNAKTAKSDRIQDKYLTAILYLAPFTLCGKGNVCPKSTEGCRQSCLFKAGRGCFSNVIAARLRKTNLWFNDRPFFLNLLRQDIKKFIKKCNKKNKLPAIRLNGTSDLPFEAFGIIQEFPEVQFYDYTAISARLIRPKSKNLHLTFSLKENNLEEASKVLEYNLGNLAVVFRNKLPETYMGRKVIDGNAHDLRFLDEKGVIVGLIAKGKAKKDQTGFVKDV